MQLQPPDQHRANQFNSMFPLPNMVLQQDGSVITLAEAFGFAGGGGGGGGVEFTIDPNTLKWLPGNVLAVDTIDDALAGNLHPITSGGVHAVVGDIETLLSTI